MDIAARYESASDVLEVGGDWYDAIELRDGRVALVVGDIVGHGIDAMISMGRLRAALSALAIHNDHPASLLTELDEFVGGPDGTAYATLFYAIVDTQEHTLTYASAGHPPALLVSPDGETIWLDQGHGEPLYGQVSTRRQASAALQPGWSLVLYSDGLIEQRGESLSVGLERLESLASEMGDRRPDVMCDALFESLVSDETRSDDTVLLVFRTGMDSEEYHQAFPARPEELRKIRSSLRSWITARGIPAAVGEDLLIAVGEATANSARHAYKDAIGGDVTIRITLMDEILNVEVSDTGKWREPVDEEAYPGLGTQIIESLAEGLRVDRTRRGTFVSFRMPLHRSAESPTAPSHSHP
jgi:anti-sigma regulatory factor (Ser/Thr protein kinase)